MSALEAVLNKFESISLEGLNQVSLLNRVDTKFMLSSEQLPQVLSEMLDQQLILEIEGLRKFNYRTHYYDTDDFSFYRDHHNGYVNRIKVRTREYTDSGLIFYEIKNKLRGTRTDKQRISLDVIPNALGAGEYEMISYKRYHGDELDVQLSNDFDRITFTNKSFTERITIDTNISFIRNEKKIALPHVAIIEVKQGKTDNFSHTIQVLKKYGIRKSSFSKYAIGVVMLVDNIKKNNFKPTLLKINKLKYV